ncbi:group II intron reverse transcriptase/maturase [Stieleria varia]|uniref:group II intron reverse transcriptase/maturase n=1 Tax=Stieleria varia TaxID=2528005 RepID=UPI0018D2063A|nr:group II intron reverse transcriptase/maturase [Stieleria varia]
MKLEGQSSGTKSSNIDRGKAVGISRDSDLAPAVLSDGPTVLTRLDRISQRAKADPGAVFNNLFSLLNYELLWYAFRRLKRGKTPGVDNVTVEDYEENLRANLQDLLLRLHRGSYRPRPSLRKNIPKGNGKTRPLGIACVEDKLVQRAVVMILEQIYEVDFHDASYGYRPKRSCHAALSTLGAIIATQRVNWISDADIEGFFDNVSHERLIELLRIRVSDPKMLRLITGFLRAGVMIDGKLTATEDGVPQGASLSPLLANVYLNYVLDQWFEQEVKPRLRGEAYIVRFADDFVCGIELESDARRYQAVLPKRLARFSLSIAEEKTKLIRFGRFARRDSQRLGEGAPAVFDFLGFTHYCGRSRAGKFKLKRKTSGKKLRMKLSEMRLWFHHQLSTPVGEMWQVLNAKLRGHYQYYGINDNWPMLMAFRSKVRRMAKRHLSRRSQKSYVNWDDLGVVSPGRKIPRDSEGRKSKIGVSSDWYFIKRASRVTLMLQNKYGNTRTPSWMSLNAGDTSTQRINTDFLSHNKSSTKFLTRSNPGSSPLLSRFSPWRSLLPHSSNLKSLCCCSFVSSGDWCCKLWFSRLNPVKLTPCPKICTSNVAGIVVAPNQLPTDRSQHASATSSFVEPVTEAGNGVKKPSFLCN